VSLRADSFIEPDWPAPAPVKAWVSTRQDGESQPPYDSFNLALHVNDDAGQVMRNRAVLASYLGLSPASFHWLEQVHGTEVMMIDSGHAQKVSPAHRPVQADASFTALARQVSVVMTADCLPVIITDVEGSVVAAVHAGWKGLLNGVIHNAIQAMDIAPSRLMAWIGPAISQYAYEVGAELRDQFVGFTEKWDQCFKPSEREGHYLCSLPRLATHWMREQGMKVYVSGCCTFSDDRFYSYRQNPNTGRMATVVWKSARAN